MCIITHFTLSNLINFIILKFSLEVSVPISPILAFKSIGIVSETKKEVWPNLAQTSSSTVILFN